MRTSCLKKYSKLPPVWLCVSVFIYIENWIQLKMIRSVTNFKLYWIRSTFYQRCVNCEHHLMVWFICIELTVTVCHMYHRFIFFFFLLVPCSFVCFFLFSSKWCDSTFTRILCIKIFFIFFSWILWQWNFIYLLRFRFFFCMRQNGFANEIFERNWKFKWKWRRKIARIIFVRFLRIRNFA